MCFIKSVFAGLGHGSEGKVLCHTSMRTWVRNPRSHIKAGCSSLRAHNCSIPLGIWEEETGQFLDACGPSCLDHGVEKQETLYPTRWEESISAEAPSELHLHAVAHTSHSHTRNCACIYTYTHARTDFFLEEKFDNSLTYANMCVQCETIHRETG